MCFGLQSVYQLTIVATLPRKCHNLESKICNHFLPAVVKDCVLIPESNNAFKMSIVIISMIGHLNVGINFGISFLFG